MDESGGPNLENNLETRNITTVLAFWSLVAKASHHLMKWSIATRICVFASSSFLQLTHIIKSLEHKGLTRLYGMEWCISLMGLVFTLNKINYRSAYFGQKEVFSSSMDDGSK